MEQVKTVPVVEYEEGKLYKCVVYDKRATSAVRTEGKLYKALPGTTDYKLYYQDDKGEKQHCCGYKKRWELVVEESCNDSYEIY